MKKNLYLLALLLCIGSSAMAQVLENSNWFVYNVGLNFTTSSGPTIFSGSQMNTWSGNASVSDENGNTLFYTNGVTVWSYNNTVMTNGTGLIGSLGGNALIIPKSLVNHTYYVVSLDGEGSHLGLHYSEVDMSVGTGEVIAGTKNTVLKDHLATDINTAYNNKSVKMTSTLHSNGTDYWLVVQIKDYIYSYLVDQYSISPTPTAVTASPINVNDVPPPGYNGPYYGQMKISPNTQRIGITHFDYAFPGMHEGALLMGDFDYSNGTISLDPVITYANEWNFLGLEFSPNSQYVYFNTELNMRYAYAYNPSVCTAAPNPNPYYNHGHTFQLAINGKIPIGHNMGGNGTEYTLGVINTPNNFSSPDIQYFTVNIAPGIAWMSLPQLVPIQPDCEQYIVLSNPDPNSAPFTYSYSDYIVDNQNYTVDNGQNINQKAGNYISIEPDTYIKPGSLFLAEITPCTGTTAGPKGKVSRPVADNLGLKINSDLLVYPNPAKGNVNIAVSTGTLNRVTITSLSGQVLYDAAAPAAQNNVGINISSYAAGIYFVSAKTNEGKQFTQKLVVE